MILCCVELLPWSLGVRVCIVGNMWRASLQGIGQSHRVIGEKRVHAKRQTSSTDFRIGQGSLNFLDSYYLARHFRPVRGDTGYPLHLFRTLCCARRRRLPPVVMPVTVPAFSASRWQC